MNSPPSNRKENRRVLFSWSSGKDSVWALHRLKQQGIEVVGLLCSINREFERVAMHGVRYELLELQAASIDLPLIPVYLTWPSSNNQYESTMRKALVEAQEEYAFTHIAFGDLFLEDVRAYRESLFADYDLLFPIWGEPTHRLSRDMIAAGQQAVITCLDPTRISRKHGGRQYNQQFLDALPKKVDPCGENGEFHTFTYDGPVFRWPLAIVAGETVDRDGFVFTDLLAE